MRIKNNTDIPDEQVSRLVKEACRGVKTANMILRIRNSSRDTATGRIWTAPGGVWTPRGGGRGNWVEAEIVVSLPRKAPCRLAFRRHGKTTLIYKGQSREAALVKIVAHEIYHLKQQRGGKRFNQAACDKFALKQLRRLGLLDGEPKETMSRGQWRKTMQEDLERNGWAWSKEHHCYVDDKQRPDLAISASGYMSKRTDGA